MDNPFPGCNLLYYMNYKQFTMLDKNNAFFKFDKTKQTEKYRILRQTLIFERKKIY